MIEKYQARANNRKTVRDLGDQLRQLRYKRRLTLDDVYMEIGIPSNYIDKIEAGYHMSWGNICLLAKFYDKKIKIELLDG